MGHSRSFLDYSCYPNLDRLFDWYLRAQYGVTGFFKISGICTYVKDLSWINQSCIIRDFQLSEVTLKAADMKGFQRNYLG